VNLGFANEVASKNVYRLLQTFLDRRTLMDQPVKKKPTAKRLWVFVFGVAAIDNLILPLWNKALINLNLKSTVKNTAIKLCVSYLKH